MHVHVSPRPSWFILDVYFRLYVIPRSSGFHLVLFQKRNEMKKKKEKKKKREEKEKDKRKKIKAKANKKIIKSK